MMQHRGIRAKNYAPMTLINVLGATNVLFMLVCRSMAHLMDSIAVFNFATLNVQFSIFFFNNDDT